MKSYHQKYYLLFSVFSFILVMFPVVNFNGVLIDTDFHLIRQNSFKKVISDYYNNVGLYRIVTITFQYYVPQLLESAPLKPFIALFAYYLASYIIAEKVLRLLGICRIKRLLVFCAFTANFLIISTALTISRSQNELISALIAWFFIWAIVKNRGSFFSTLLLIFWGIVSLLTYELHFPFLAILLFSLGYISKKEVFYATMLAIIFLVFIIPLGSHKIAGETSALRASSELIFQYISSKLSSAVYSLGFIELKDIILPSVIASLFIMFIYQNWYSFEKTGQNFHYLTEVQIAGLSLGLLLLIYTISWPTSSPYSFETIKAQGKLNWNVINLFWFNITLALILRLNSRLATFIRILPILLLLFYSGLVTRSVSNLAEDRQFDQIDRSLFKNVNYYQ